MRLFLSLLACSLVSSAASAQPAAPRQFDFVCSAKDEGGAAETPRFSVDLDKKAWCTRDGADCTIATLFGSEGDVIVFERSQLETGAYDHWVNRKTGEYRSTTSGTISTDSRGSCKEAAFTPFGVTLNDGAKAARN
ncbi:hypothetical protein BH09PSE2_BH09PSE2_09720 [soil metagenome]